MPHVVQHRQTVQTTEVAFGAPGAPDSDSLRVKYRTTKKSNLKKTTTKTTKKPTKSSLGPLSVLINRKILLSLLTPTE